MSDLDTLEAHVNAIKTHVERLVIDPFDRGILATYTNNALAEIARLKAQQKPPALAPGKHEPEPIIFAAQKKPRPRAQKGH
jgi:hypothetical protein